MIALRTDSDAERRATKARAAADRVEIALLNLQTGSRGFILTNDRRFLTSWEIGRRTLGSAARELVSAGAAADAATAREVAAASSDYLAYWSVPLVRLARRDPAAAGGLLATRRGERRINRLRSLLASLDVAAARVSAARSDATQAEMERAIAAGSAGFLVSVLLVIFCALYLDRLVLGPVRRVGAAARAVGKGNLSARVPVVGRGEVAELGLAFNRMADELGRATGLRKAVFDSVVDGVCVTDLGGNILLSNARLDQLAHELGIPVQGTVYERLHAMADEVTDPAAYRAAMRRIEREWRESSDEFVLAGSGRSFRGFTGPVRDSSGATVGRIFTLRETTAERQSERLKDEFVANVSHELRTPLTSISGYLELLVDDARLGAEHRAQLAVVERNAQRLLRLVGDLLFVTQVDAGAFRLELEPVDPAVLADQAVEALRPVAEQRGVDLRLEAEAVRRIEADPVRLGQLLDNLVSNALKFTPAKGRVAVRVGDRDGAVELSVADTGTGIDPDDGDRLFERFARAESAQRSAVPGAGLGLAIVKAIAEAHGGDVAVASEPGQGTVFTVRLPLRRAESVAA